MSENCRLLGVCGQAVHLGEAHDGHGDRWSLSNTLLIPAKHAALKDGCRSATRQMNSKTFIALCLFNDAVQLQHQMLRVHYEYYLRICKDLKY